MRRQFLTSILLVLVFTLISTNSALAGFGISPPYVRNENLTRNSHFEQKIILVRDKPEEDWQVELIFNVPGANNWFSVDKGKKFILPKGEEQTPIVIGVNVPKDVKFKDYKGFIRVKTTPLKTQEPGIVAIVLGGQIDVDLNVTNKVFDFKVKGVKVSDLEEGEKRWIFYFPGIIKFSMQIENLGNIKASPSKVHFDIYDRNEKEILESIETDKITKVDPFKTDWVITNLHTKLGPGSYWVRYKIFKKSEVVNQGRIHLSILPKGTITSYQRATIFDLGLRDKLIILLGILAILGLAGFAVSKIIRISRGK